MNINEIQDGYVIDHIHAGRAMRIYRHLGLDKLDCSVAIIKNAKSARMGRKDIIKIDELIPLNVEIISSIDSGATVNTIQNGVLIRKQRLSVPERVVNVLRVQKPALHYADGAGNRAHFRACEPGKTHLPLPVLRYPA